MADPYNNLASAIIMSALDDLDKYDPDGKKKSFYFAARSFLGSKWFKMLADGVDIHPDQITKKAEEIKLKHAEKWLKTLPKSLKSSAEAVISSKVDKGQTRTNALIHTWELDREEVHSFAQFCRLK